MSLDLSKGSHSGLQNLVIELIKKISFLLAALLTMSACAYTQPARNHVAGSDVGGTGDVKYTHEKLGNEKHMLTVTAAPGMMETESSIAQRVHVFANKFAASTCSRAFEFIHDPNFEQDMSKGFMKRTKTYVFLCRP